MTLADDVLSSTTSLCPTCLERIPGRYEAHADGVYLSRTCPTHGEASRKVWDSVEHWKWAADYGPTLPDGDVPSVDDATGCGCVGGCGDLSFDDTPLDAGDDGSDLDAVADPSSDLDPDLGLDSTAVDDGSDLAVDNDHACLAVVEVTQDCNLSCSYCFASSGPGGRQLPAEEVVQLLDVVRSGGGPRPIQFSGGEPTIRDDLPELVEAAVGMGFEHIEVNTNGLMLAYEDGYAERLADAGVTAVYLQFDGLEADTYREIRDADILEAKHDALAACRRADLPVILVPTVVPGTNDHEMGDIVRFALENLDVVRSVNFQPVAHFGRYAENEGRFSLDAAAERLADQLDDVDVTDLMPVPCCSSYCQTATALVPDGEGGVVPLTRFLADDLWQSVIGAVDEADWMELLAKTPNARDMACQLSGCCGMDASDGGEGLLESVLPVTITGFMDADAADVDRLQNCCISVPTPDGDLVPFCAYNMTTEAGEYALRNRYGWGGRSTVTGDDVASDPDVAVESDDD